VNELEFIRRQVSIERTHMAAVRSACAAALSLPRAERPEVEFLRACAEYLVFVVGRFNAQDQAHCDLLGPRLPTSATHDLATLEDLGRTLEASRGAIAKLEIAVRAGSDEAFVAALRTYLAFYSNVLAGHRHALHHLFDAHYEVADWRAASAVDADAILEERERYARVAGLIPDDIELAPTRTDVPQRSPAASGTPPDSAGSASGPVSGPVSGRGS